MLKHIITAISKVTLYWLKLKVQFGGEVHTDMKRVLLLATGAGKAEIIAKAVEGPITSMISATALQMHPRCTVIVDEAAAAKLQGVDYYRWIFANEPEWEEYRPQRVG